MFGMNVMAWNGGDLEKLETFEHLALECSKYECETKFMKMQGIFKSCIPHLNCKSIICFRNFSRCPEVPILSFEKYPGNTSSPIVILHGLLGNRNNWKSTAKALAQKTSRTVYTVDARNHGESPHTPTMTYPLMGHDLIAFMKREALPSACVIGHSMGGRTAMAAALIAPEVVSELLVLDISPFGVSETISTLPRFVEMMRRIQLPSELSLPQARKIVDEMLQPVVLELGVRQFLLTNLYKADGGEFKWRANLDAISLCFNPHICTFPLDELPGLYEGPTTFIGGALSDYIKRSDHRAIKQVFPRAEFHYLQGAGHWLHADKPKEFLSLVSSILSKAG
ncbi:Alpha/beta hydrolase fold-1 [Trinorchestia longiramus]|nr:Alpha/beta hydrolase fold-1 [Trinorchestia longiramus]